MTVDSDKLWVFGNTDGKGTYTDDRSAHFTLSLAAAPIVVGGSSSWANGRLSFSLDHSSGASEVEINFK